MIPDNSNQKWMSSLSFLISSNGTNVTQSNGVFFFFFSLFGTTKQIQVGVKASLKSSLEFSVENRCGLIILLPTHFDVQSRFWNGDILNSKSVTH